MSQEELYEHLRFLRFAFKDDVPSKIVHSDELDNRYKVRKGWWVGLLADLELGLLLQYFPVCKQRLIQEFVDTYRNSDFGKPEILTTASDIQSANSLLDRVLLSVSKG